MTETPTLASSYTFDPFAATSFTTMSTSRWCTWRFGGWTRTRPAGEPVRVVELASGTGAVTELILDELERLGRPATVIGVEPSQRRLRSHASLDRAGSASSRARPIDW